MESVASLRESAARLRARFGQPSPAVAVREAAVSIEEIQGFASAVGTAFAEDNQDSI